MKYIVYRYIDKTDGIIKYVGISREGMFKQRIAMHASKDKWKYRGAWRIEYFECDNQSEAEAFESHLIGLYGTGKYYNKSKANWGTNQYFPSVEDKWMLFKECCFEDAETNVAAELVRWLLRNKHREEARSLLDCFALSEE